MHMEIVICKCIVPRINMKRLKERKMSQEKDIKMNPSTNEYPSKLNRLFRITFSFYTQKNLKENNNIIVTLIIIYHEIFMSLEYYKS